MTRIFISHSSLDNLAALAFKRWLETHGWGAEDVFHDLHGIGAGQRWKKALKSANVRCEAVVFLSSPEALASKECGVELRMADDHPGVRHCVGEDVCKNVLNSPPRWEFLAFWRQR